MGAPDEENLGIAGVEGARLIGRGGFGVVYRARQQELNRQVAVKVLTAALDDAAAARFGREAYAMGTLAGHPNIVPVFATGTTAARRPYLLMPYLPKGSLDARAPIGWEEAVRHSVRLAGALETAHRAGVLHRDIKPANVLLSEFGEPMLADFGIARMSFGFQTATGVVAASLAYAPPEVLAGGAATVRSDVYSLAATLYCLIAGAPPFQPRPGEELIATYVRIARDTPPRLDGFGLPAAFEEVLVRGLAKDPAARPTAAEFGEQLQECQRAHGLPVTPISLPDAVEPAPRTLAPEVLTLDASVSRVSSAAEPAAKKGPRRLRRGALVISAAAIGTALLVIAITLGRGALGGAAVGPSVASNLAVRAPSGLAAGRDGSLYISDGDRHQVLRVEPSGQVSVVAGTGVAGNSGNGGPAAAATLDFPSDVAVGPGGEIYVVSGGRVRLVTDDGRISSLSGLPPDVGVLEITVATDGTLYAADRKSILVRDPEGRVETLFRTEAASWIEDLAVHPGGGLAVADAGGQQILLVQSDGQATRIAGLGGPKGARGDGSPATQSEIAGPTGLAYDAAGRLVFTDVGTNRVRRIETDQTVRTLAGSPEGYSEGSSGDGGPGQGATLRPGTGSLAIVGDDLYVADVGNHRIRRLDSAGVIHALG